MGLPVVNYSRKIPFQVFEQSEAASVAAANEIAGLIRRKAAAGEMCVLGLATGSTPKLIYKELVRMHRKEGLSFKNVITFNLDEYYPMARDDVQSYWYFMHEHLFNHVDIVKENINIPNGELAVGDVDGHGRCYEEKIGKAGGLDLQLLGVGRNGHIGFNEPGASKCSRTRLVSMHAWTRSDASKDFGDEAKVPNVAITMGIGTILSATRILLLAFGEKKAQIIGGAVNGPMTSALPASFLQEHPNTLFMLDADAAAKLR